jgi:hypothetical protein
MSGSVGLTVAVRCRPFSMPDKLGVTLQQQAGGGVVSLLNSTYTNTNFSFSYAWWSAVGYARHIQSNVEEADKMKMVDQVRLMRSALHTRELL